MTARDDDDDDDDDDDCIRVLLHSYYPAITGLGGVPLTHYVQFHIEAQHGM